MAKRHIKCIENIFGSGRPDPISSSSSSSKLFLLGRPLTLPKKPKSSSFQIRLGQNLAGLSSRKYVSIDGVGLRIWRHAFKMAAVTSSREKP